MWMNTRRGGANSGADSWSWLTHRYRVACQKLVDGENETNNNIRSCQEKRAEKLVADLGRFIGLTLGRVCISGLVGFGGCVAMIWSSRPPWFDGRDRPARLRPGPVSPGTGAVHRAGPGAAAGGHGATRSSGHAHSPGSLLSLLLLMVVVMAAVMVSPSRAELVLVHQEGSGDQEGVWAVWRDNPFFIDTQGDNVCFQTGLRLATDFIGVGELYKNCHKVLPQATCSALRSDHGLLSSSDIYIPAQNYTCCDGYEQQGPSCSKPCPANTYGPACNLSCPCLNGGACDPLDGTCRCPPGWTGHRCQRTCSNGSYGQDCLAVCRCQTTGGVCDPVTGDCLCYQYFVGDNCETDCSSAPTGTVGCPNPQGAFCDGRCGEDSWCDYIAGFCHCLPGWEGALCRHTCTEAWTQGAHCNHTCNCNRTGTEACLPADGSCLCRPGWKGERCDRPCPAGRYGPDCRLRCNCPTANGCDPITGRCNSCPRGWQGEMCTSPCESDLWGRDCGQDCDCAESDACDAVSGLCVHAATKDSSEESFVPTTPFTASQPPLSVGHIAAIAGAAGLVLLLLVIVVVWRSRKKPPLTTPARLAANGQTPAPGTQRYARNATPPTPMPRDPSTFTTGPLPPDPANHYEPVGARSSTGPRNLRHQPHSYLELEGARPTSLASSTGGGQLPATVAASPPSDAGGYEIPTPQGTLDRSEPQSLGMVNHYALLNADDRDSSEYMYLQL